MKPQKVIVIGGGAAGYFAAITAAEMSPRAQVTLIEASAKPLAKVRVSGGGRCNVTNGCTDSAEFVKQYPRGSQELHGPFSRFQAKDTMQWFERRGVSLKVEADGRVFPVSDSSKTITDCLEDAAQRAGVTVRLRCKALGIEAIAAQGGGFRVSIEQEQRREFIESRNVLLATGSASRGYAFARKLGHTIQPCVPSLFTFELNDERLTKLSGVSVPQASLALAAASSVFVEAGPLLITHWGLSGPAVIRLSAWAARPLFDCGYAARLKVNWLGEMVCEHALEELLAAKDRHPKRSVFANAMFGLPKRLWEYLVTAVGISEQDTWATIAKRKIRQLAEALTGMHFEVCGKGVFKEEFVTCGGVTRKELDFRTMESRQCRHLFFAGEILDIDGVTGGFNFQAAWTTAWIAGCAMAAS